MRREKELNVNVHEQTIEARRRTNNGSGRLHGTFDEPQPKWFQRYFRWEKILMPTKTVEKGFVVTPTIAAVLLAAFLSAIGWAYTSNTKDARETRDAIIEMKTMLNERTTTFKEQQATLETKLNDERTLAKLQRDNQNDKLRQMEYALKQKGIRLE